MPPDLRWTPYHRALLALTFVQLLFGTLPVAAKLAIPAFGAGSVAFYRIAGAAVVFQLWRWFAKIPLPTRRDLPLIFLCALLGIAGNQLFFLFGLKYTTAVNATLIVTLSPVLTYGIAMLLRREQFNIWRIMGMCVGLLGVALLVAGDVGGGRLIGDLMILLNTSLYAIYLVISRPLLQKYAPLAVVAMLFTLSIPVTLLAVGLPTVQAPLNAWLALIYVVIGPTIGTYYLNLYALKEVPASTVALFIYLQPFITTLTAMTLLGESPGSQALLSGLLSFAGVYLATRHAQATQGR